MLFLLLRSYWIADDLNPLYVYEAKMSLFTRMAQTRPGAERLLEAQILPVLSQCEYLDTRPEEDQSFMGKCRCCRPDAPFWLTLPQTKIRSCLVRSSGTTSCLCPRCSSL